MAVQWTKEQGDAIAARGGGILVSAAAGSGKTAVLSQRVIGLLLDPDHPVDADRLLVVTFSRAAAAEMKSRISQMLWERLEADPHQPMLQRQHLLLENASISTIHAFCAELLRQNFHVLGISPDFRIADERELRLLRAQAVEETLGDFYSREDQDFEELVELLSTSRSDKRTQETVLRLYDFLRSHAFYRDWLAQTRALYDPDLPVERSLWGRCLLEHSVRGLSYAAVLARQALELMADDPAMEKAYRDCFVQDLDALEQLEALARSGSWDSLTLSLRSLVFSPLGRLTKYEDTEKRDLAKGLRDEIKGIVAQLRDKCFCALGEEHREDMLYQGPLVDKLFEVVLAFDDRLTKLKEQRNLLDFPDLEHGALGLLVEKVDGVCRPTEAAREIAARYDEVLIDEYQDTNSAQDAIFAAISRQGSNLFLVGDVKQSIYRFRQAMPEIFIEKKDAFAPYDGAHFPAKIILGRNFRSRSQITAFINDVFGLLMSRALGEIDYGPEEELIPGATYPPPQGPPVELLLLDLGKDEERVEAEAAHVAHLVEELLASAMEVGPPDARRPVEPGDICLLMRSLKDRAPVYEKAMKARGISLWTDNQTGFLRTPEIGPVVAFLRVVDNPLLDLELLHSLLSPLWGFSADRLAQIRERTPKGPLYLALGESAKAGEEDCVAFLQTLEKLRRDAATLPARDVLLRLYDLTGFLSVSRVMEFGEVRLANLRLLADYAGDYESRGFRGLTGFVRFLTQLLAQGEDLPPAALQARRAVRLMSVHRSKGLEFPVVILADTGRAFNTMDLRQNTLLHSRLGFACMRRDRELLSQYSTVPMEAIKVAGRQGMLSEELRVLYVALTRAREKLIITGTVKDAARELASLCRPLDRDSRLSPWVVGDGTSLVQWLAMAALHLPGGTALREYAGLSAQVKAGGEGFACTVAPPLPSAQPDPAQQEEAVRPLPDPQALEALGRSLGFVYPHEGAVHTPSKLGVSDIARGGGGFDYAPRPAFLQEAGLTAAERGTALHKFLQFANYHQAARAPREELARLVEARFLSREEGDAVDLPKLERFFASPLARRIFASPQVHRELRFLCEAGEELLAPYYAQLPPGQTTVVQGVADCVFLEDGAAVVVDYKTDFIANEAEFVARYTPQLEIYGRILGQVVGAPVKECVLYAFSLGKEIRIV